MSKEGKYEKIGKEIGKLVDEKNKAYGDSFSQSDKILKILFPNGIGPEAYNDLLTITRVIDKLFRIATDKEAFGESPWKDIAGYAILSAFKQDAKEQEDFYKKEPVYPVEEQKERCGYDKYASASTSLKYFNVPYTGEPPSFYNLKDFSLEAKKDEVYNLEVPLYPKGEESNE